MEFVHPFDDFEALCRLYGDAFSVSEKYLRFLSERGWLNPSVLYAVTENGELQSALAAPQYMLRCGDFEGLCSYFCYVASFTKSRSKGYASALIRFAIEDLNKQKVPFVCLIPATTSLFSYYGRFGFSEMFSYSKTMINPNGFEAGTFQKISSEKVEDYYPRYQERYQKMPFCCYKPKSMFSAYAAEHILSGGEIFTDGQDVIFAMKEPAQYRVVEYSGSPSFQAFCNSVDMPVCIEDAGSDSVLGMGLVLDHQQICPADLSGNLGYCNAMFN